MFHIWERPIFIAVQVIAKRTLKLFWSRHRQAETPLRAWHATVSPAAGCRPAAGNAPLGAQGDFVGPKRRIKELAGNKYRLIVHVAYAYKRVLIKFVGTHAEYDRINPETV